MIPEALAKVHADLAEVTRAIVDEDHPTLIALAALNVCEAAVDLLRELLDPGVVRIQRRRT